jgi:hypothetical protein
MSSTVKPDAVERDNRFRQDPNQAISSMACGCYEVI